MGWTFFSFLSLLDPSVISSNPPHSFKDFLVVKITISTANCEVSIYTNYGIYSVNQEY